MTNCAIERRAPTAAARARAGYGLLFVAFAAAACARPTGGDEGERGDRGQKGEAIVAGMLDAIGSRNARAAVRSLRTVAEGSGPDGLFVTSMTSIRPDAVYFHQENGLGTTEIWSTPERTWGGSQGEAYAEFAPAVRDFVRNHEFHLLLLDMRERFSEFRYEGSETVDGDACRRVAMTAESGDPASVCVREADHLPAELALERGEEDPIRIEFGDWRRIDGLRLFHSFRLYEGTDDVFTYDYIEISAASFGQALEVPEPALPERR